MRSFFKTSCLSAFLLLFVATAYAQQTTTLQTDNSPTITFFLVPHFNPLFGLGYVNPDKSLLEVADGSQYFDEEFKEVKVSATSKAIKGRYNAFFDEMEIENGKEKGWINKYRQREKIIFTEDNTVYKILDGDDRPEMSALGYYEVLLESNRVALYKKNAKKLAVGLEQSPYMIPVQEVVTEFQKLKTEYYVEFNNNGNAQKLSRTRRGVAKLFVGKEDIVKAYIKENKLKVINDEDLIQIITYVNSL
ncbi:hypothetical protein KORDIASMS9_00720 [Kordia sp. SMS9]|uniref:hypothetical protein n=1 Tax=Kordia sp. SMS9 TaxID=2282170 RepID=UPI000E0D905C|nr:hypothetical protein [Kordia sp. SMS9]AXG68505.1 hypothetical protein KORDIASMS9_00720 [Kordia sp. SMS9]